MDYQALRQAVSAAFEDPRADCEGDYSRLIYRLQAFLEQLGLRVECPAPDLERDGVRGRISFKERWVKLDEPDSKMAAQVLAHEAGHWLSHMRLPHLYDPENDSMGDDEELLAYLYGWTVLRWLDTERLVDKMMWREHHDALPAVRNLLWLHRSWETEEQLRAVAVVLKVKDWRQVVPATERLLKDIEQLREERDRLTERLKEIEE